MREHDDGIDTMTEKVPVELVGGPMDGYDGIDIWNDRIILIPFPHHRRACRCKSLPIYKRDTERIYRFIGYESVLSQEQ